MDDQAKKKMTPLMWIWWIAWIVWIAFLLFTFAVNSDWNWNWGLVGPAAFALIVIGLLGYEKTRGRSTQLKLSQSLIIFALIFLTVPIVLFGALIYSKYFR